jgi:hypothetical protein
MSVVFPLTLCSGTTGTSSLGLLDDLQIVGYPLSFTADTADRVLSLVDGRHQPWSRCCSHFDFVLGHYVEDVGVDGLGRRSSGVLL